MLTDDEIRDQYEHNWTLLAGAEAVCPMCQKPFIKTRKAQGCCKKDPCGNAYTKKFRNTERKKSSQGAPYVGQYHWPLVGSR